jgi:hypothetical protein
MSFRDELWATIYATRGVLRVLTVFLVFLFGLTLVSFYLGHQRATTTAVAYANLVLTGGAAMLAVALYWYSMTVKEGD